MTRRLSLAMALLLICGTVYAQQSWVLRTNGLVDGGVSIVRDPTASVEMEGAFARDANNMWVVGVRTLIYRSFNGGLNWTGERFDKDRSSPITLRDIRFCPTDTNRGIVVGGGGTAANNYLLFTLNGGRTWTQTFAGNPAVNSVRFLTPAIAIAAGRGGQIIRTTDTGRTWTPIPQGITRSDMRKVFALNATTAMVVGDSGVVMRSDDAGLTWTRIRTPSPSRAFRAVWMADANTIWVAGDSGNVFFSTNAGANWVKQGIGAGDTTRMTDMQFVSRSTGYMTGGGLGTLPGALWTTTNGGTTWTRVAGLPTVAEFSAVSIAGTNGVIACDSGIVLTPAAPLSTRIETAARPTEFALDQNYPNPFNPSTVISYQLPTSSDVKLVVYDMLGRELSTLVNTRQTAGRYQATFNAAGLSSGIYFYRLQAGTFTETRKMMLVK